MAHKSTANGAFQYETLPTRTSIRLLDVLPPATGGVIHCHIRTVDLQQDPKPVFTAVSYEWTDPFPDNSAASAQQSASLCTENTDLRKILIDGARLNIGSNLWKFLDSLGRSELAHNSTYGGLSGPTSQDRPPANSIFFGLWADAICINQGDVLEKNHQVQYMKSIYSNAKRVVIWLGLKTGCSEFMTLVGFQSRVAALVRSKLRTQTGNATERAKVELPDYEVLELIDLREGSTNELTEVDNAIGASTRGYGLA